MVEGMLAIGGADSLKRLFGGGRPKEIQLAAAGAVGQEAVSEKPGAGAAAAPAAGAAGFSVEKAAEIYSRNLKNFSIKAGSNELYIHDPSAREFREQKLPKIVSEGMSWYQILAARMAAINSAKKEAYQKDFDSLLAGTEKMIRLAKEAGSAGEFPAWKVAIKDGRVILFPSNDGPQNSAADADLDLIKSLIYAQDNVEKKLWSDKKYGEKALALIQHATRALFTDENGVLVLRPSEDWDAFHFTDYLEPATCQEIAEFCTKKGQGNLATAWHKAARDSMKLYAASLRDTGEFPAHVEFQVKSSSDIKANAKDGTHQTYDGIRSSWHIGESLGGFAATAEEMSFGLATYQAGQRKNFSFTYSLAMDKAMYLPLARALGKNEEVKQLTSEILGNLPLENKYFENTLVLLGLVATHYPARSFSNPVPAAPMAPAPRTEAAPVTPKPEPAPAGKSAKKEFKLNAADWDVNSSRITSGNISASGNSIELKRVSTSDAVGFKFRAGNAAGSKYLVVTVKGNFSGRFDWGGKVFKIEFNERPATPVNVSVSDNYVNSDTSGEIYYKIPASTGDIQIVFGRMSGASGKLEFYLADEMK